MPHGGASSGSGRGSPVTFDSKLRFLAGAFPGSERIETHTAFVFLTAERAFKLKKPINLGYLDHRSLAAREHACREEVRLNRQLAGEAVYLGLVALVRDGAGRLALGGEGRVVDWLVEMLRLPAERMLDEVLRAGSQPTRAEIAAVTDRLVAFYKARQAEPARPGLYLRHLQQESAVNTRNLRQMDMHLTGFDCCALAEQTEATIARHEAEITRRDRDRLVVEGHGDLRPEHVCLTSPPVIFDRIEFAADMLMIDLYDEANYLGLECAMLGAGWIGDQVLAAMRAAGFAAPSAGLLATYGLFRCLTRARLSLDHLREPNPRTPEKWPRQARAYLARAADLLRTIPAP